METKPVAYIVIEHDEDPDMSWLEQDHYNPRHPSYDPIYRTKEDMDAGRAPMDGDWYRNPENHVALEMVAYDEDDGVIDSLGGIDFLADSDDWRTGTFVKLSTLAKCPYLQELAKEMGLA